MFDFMQRIDSIIKIGLLMVHALYQAETALFKSLHNSFLVYVIVNTA